LFTKFKRETKRLFLDPRSLESIFYEKGERFDIILSPALYWVKKIALPITSVREVKKLLPSIFEESLPEGDYSYYAYKHGEEFFVFAYEDKKIFDFLNQKGVAYSDIASVRFAQSEFDTIESTLCINEKECLYLKDELVILVPSEWIDKKEMLDIKNLKLSNHTIKLQQYGHIVDKSSLVKIGAILLALAFIFIAEIFIASVKKDELITAREEIFPKYKLLPTMFQNRSSLEKYRAIDEQGKKLREMLSYFFKMKLVKEQKLIHIAYKNKLLSVKFSGVTQANIKTITEELDSKNVKYTKSFKGDKLSVEIKI